MIFMIGSTDYSGCVVAGSYKVNNDPVFNEWKNGNAKTCKQKIRDKIVGSLDVFFRSLADYNDFLTALADATSDEETLLTVSVNNTGETKSSYFFVTFDPARDIDGTWNDFIPQFTLNIEEA